MKKEPSQKPLLKVYKRKTDNSYMVKSDYYNIVSYGQTKKEAIENIQTEIRQLTNNSKNINVLNIEEQID